jgi:hypothetical protein
MDIIYDLRTGWPSKHDLTRRVSAYARSDRCTAFKIGITGNPKKRAQIYRANGADYGRMIILYQTSSEKNIREMERVLCELYSGISENSNKGGGGKLSLEKKYYLYIILKAR